jgi:small-conductance mechanosensitive channel
MMVDLLFKMGVLLCPFFLIAVVALPVLLARAVYKSWLPPRLLFAATVGPVIILGNGFIGPHSGPFPFYILDGVAVGSLALAIRRLMVDFFDRIASDHSAFNQIARSNNGAADAVETGRLDGPVPLPPNARRSLAFVIMWSIVVMLWIPLFFLIVGSAGPIWFADVYEVFIGIWGGANLTAVGVLIGIVVFVTPGRWIRGDQNAAQACLAAIVIAAAVFYQVLQFALRGGF